jgi:oligopeptide/dipeptide ABC transporter ATP-binding protein
MPQIATPGQRLTVIPGQVPRPGSVAAGCRFRARCPYAADRCSDDPMPLTIIGDAAAVRCVRHEQLELHPPPTPPVPGPAAIVAHEPLLEVRRLRKEFPVTTGILRRVRGHIRAVDGVDLTVGAGETLGLVGESGSGKSTVARLVLRLIDPTGGSVVIGGDDLARLRGPQLRRARANMQMIFQDPYSSLDPRATIASSVGEPLTIHRDMRGIARDQRVAELLDLVGIGSHLLGRYPHEFSGGQRQRIAVARALALEPRLLVCDEPVSSLDVSTQSQVINLLADLQERLGLAYLFIAHDLSVVRHLSHRIAVMYLGRIVETGPADEVYHRPRHPYTEALLSAIPIPDPKENRARERQVVGGEPPNPIAPPSGCRFHTRCPRATEVCKTVEPPLAAYPGGHLAACHHPLNVDGSEMTNATRSPLSPLSSGRLLPSGKEAPADDAGA